MKKESIGVKRERERENERGTKKKHYTEGASYT